IEVTSRDEVDSIAKRGQEEGCLAWPPTDMPPPIGYICALTDPDGNMIEFSYDQGVYATVQEVWGNGS
ncbi:MAG TPA: VOC family protein, partial [Ilumatobacteraceae bacterium]